MMQLPSTRRVKNGGDTHGASASYSYDTLTLLSGDDESTIQQPLQSGWRELENYLYGDDRQSLDHTASGGSTDDEETFDGTYDGGFSSPVNADAESLTINSSIYTYGNESYSFEVPHHKPLSPKVEDAPYKVQVSPQYGVGNIFNCSKPKPEEGWQALLSKPKPELLSKPKPEEGWQELLSNHSEPEYSPISPTGNPVVLSYPPYYHQRKAKAIEETPPFFEEQVKIKPISIKSMNQEHIHHEQQSRDLMQHGAGNSADALPEWSVDEDEIVFEGTGEDPEDNALWNNPRLWSKAPEIRKPSDAVLELRVRTEPSDIGNREDAHLERGASTTPSEPSDIGNREDAHLEREASTTPSNSGKSDSASSERGTKRRGLIRRMTPRAFQKLKRAGNRFRNDRKKTTAADDTQQTPEDMMVPDIGHQDPALDARYDAVKRAIVSPREAADEPPIQKKPQRRPRRMLSVETEDLQVSPQPDPSPAREGLDSPRKNLQRTIMSVMPKSPLADRRVPNARIIDPGADETEGIEVAAHSPRKFTLPKKIARVFKSPKLLPDRDRTRKGASPGLQLAITTSTIDSDLDENIELTTEGWQLSVSKWSPSNRSDITLADDAECMEIQIESNVHQGVPESCEAPHNDPCKARYPILPGRTEPSDAESTTSSRGTSEHEHLPSISEHDHLPKNSPRSITEERLSPETNIIGRRRKQKVPKTFQAPTGPSPEPRKSTPIELTRNRYRKSTARELTKNRYEVSPVNSLLREEEASVLSETSFARRLLTRKRYRKSTAREPTKNRFEESPANSLLLEEEASVLSETSFARRLHSPFGLMGLAPKKKFSKSKPKPKPTLRGYGKPSSKKEKRVLSLPDSSNLEGKIPEEKIHSKVPLQLPKRRELKVARNPFAEDGELPDQPESAVVPYDGAASQPGCSAGGPLDRAIKAQCIASPGQSKNGSLVLYPILDFNPCRAELLMTPKFENRGLQPQERILHADTAEDPETYNEESMAAVMTDTFALDPSIGNSTVTDNSLKTKDEQTTPGPRTRKIHRLKNPFASRKPSRKTDQETKPVPFNAASRALSRADKRNTFMKSIMKKARKARLKPDGRDSDQKQTGNGVDPQSVANSNLDQSEENTKPGQGNGHAESACAEEPTTTGIVPNYSTTSGNETKNRVLFEQDLFESSLKPRMAETPRRAEDGVSRIPVELPRAKPAIRKGRFGTPKEGVDSMQSTQSSSSNTGLGLTDSLDYLRSRMMEGSEVNRPAKGSSQSTEGISNLAKDNNDGASVTWSIPTSERSKKSVEFDQREVDRLEVVEEKLARRLATDLRLLALIDKRKSKLRSPGDASTSTSGSHSHSYPHSNDDARESFNTLFILKAVDGLVKRRMEEEAIMREESASAAKQKSNLGGMLSDIWSCSSPAKDDTKTFSAALYEA